MNSLGSQLKRLRLEKRISQKEMANALEIGQTTVANYEADIRQPNLEKLAQIADFFNVSVDELLGRSLNYQAGNELNETQTVNNIIFDDAKLKLFAK